MKSQHCMHTITPVTPQGGFGLPPWVLRGCQALAAWMARSRQRQHLAELNDHMLRDLGLSRADVQFEIKKPFWRP